MSSLVPRAYSCPARARVGSGDETMNTFPVSVGGIMLNFFLFIIIFFFYLSNMLKLCPKFAYWKEHRKQGGSSFTTELQDRVTSSIPDSGIV